MANLSQNTLKQLNAIFTGSEGLAKILADTEAYAVAFPQFTTMFLGLFDQGLNNIRVINGKLQEQDVDAFLDWLNTMNNPLHQKLLNVMLNYFVTEELMVLINYCADSPSQKLSSPVIAKSILTHHYPNDIRVLAWALSHVIVDDEVLDCFESSLPLICSAFNDENEAELWIPFGMFVKSIINYAPSNLDWLWNALYGFRVPIFIARTLFVFTMNSVADRSAYLNKVLVYGNKDAQAWAASELNIEN